MADRERLAASACADPRCGARSTPGSAVYIIIGTIPIGVFGLIFKDQIETGARDLTLIGCTLIALGLLLLLAEKVATHTRGLDSLTARDGIIVGIAQALRARAGRLALGRDDHRRPVPRLQPRRRGALLVPALGPRGRALRPVRAAPRRRRHGRRRRCRPRSRRCVAFVVGYWSIAFLLRYLGNHSTVLFVAYRVALGTLVLVPSSQPGAIS